MYLIQPKSDKWKFWSILQELADIWKSNRDIHFKPTCPLGRIKILIEIIADLYKRVSEGCFMNGETCKEKRKEKRRLYLEQKQFLTQECFFFLSFCTVYGLDGFLLKRARASAHRMRARKLFFTSKLAFLTYWHFQVCYIFGCCLRFDAAAVAFLASKKRHLWPKQPLAGLVNINIPCLFCQ